MIMQADAVSNCTSSLMKEVFYSNTELLTFLKNGLSRIETAPSLWLMDSSPHPLSFPLFSPWLLPCQFSARAPFIF